MEYEIVKMSIKVDGEKKELAVDLNKLHPSQIARLLAYGTARKINDTYSGEKGQTKFDLCEKMIEDLESGAEFVKTVSRPSAVADPVGAMATKAAKDYVLTVLKTATGKARIGDIAATDAGKPFFTETGGKLVWDEKAIAAHVAKRLEAGHDYRAIAQEAYDTAQAAAEAVSDLI